MRRVLLPLLAIVACTLRAQPFAIGSTNLTFNDPARGGRSIPCEVYYPAVSAGAGTAVASGRFPVLVFGHGFVMGVNAYYNYRQALVPEGFILVLPTTEGGLAPAHQEFGRDLAYCVTAMQALGAATGNIFTGRISSASALMGHSMGGGASFLGAAANASISALVNFAAAETNPSAIAAAAAVNVPTLVLAGSQDCVTPPGTNQLPMYTATASACKAYVSITGGGHCFFANSNFNCSFGEGTCGGAGSLTRAQQQDAAQDMALLWLRRYLKDDPSAGAAFADSLSLSARITDQSTFGDCPAIVVRAGVRALLDGPYDEAVDRMRDDLRVQSLIPLTEPNTAAGFVHVGYGVGQQLTPALLTVAGDDALVDWVFVELRDAGAGAQVVATANGLLQRDGDIVGADGAPLRFTAPPGSYRIAVRHRNHLGCMTASPAGLTRDATAIDLSAPGLPVFGTEPRALRNGRALLWCGNARRDGSVKYTGSNNDRDPVLLRLGGTTPNAVAVGYFPEDADLDGVVKYIGAGNDRDRILITVGSTAPNNVRGEQLP